MYIRTGLGTLRSIRERLSRYTFEVENPQPLVPAVETRPTAAAAGALERIGRCEDLRISPNGRQLAIPGYHSAMCLVLTLDYDAASGALDLLDFIEIESPGIVQPHGIDWVDDDTLAVGNRGGSVAVIRVPPEMGGRHVRLDPLSMVHGKGFARMAWPGSVAVTRNANGVLSILACHNYADRVSRHVIDPALKFRETDSEVLFARGLYIPDGIAISPDGDHIAVSCHGSHTVAVYSASRTGRFAAPLGRLSGPHYPHGLRFSADGEHLLVADAGSPYVHVYARESGWAGERGPVRSVQVLDEETYLRGRTQPDEGGPKGIDLDPGGRFALICCEEVRLKALAVRPLLGEPHGTTAV